MCPSGHRGGGRAEEVAVTQGSSGPSIHQHIERSSPSWSLEAPRDAEMGDSLKTRESLPAQHKGLTVQPISNVYPTVGESPSGPFTHFGEADGPKPVEDERRQWDERRVRAAEERGPLREADEDEPEGNGPPSKGSAQAAAPSAPPPGNGPYPLHTSWAVWEHRLAERGSSYEQNMLKLIEFSTVEDFWRAWNNLPKPSDIFFDGKTYKKVGDHMIESLSLFKSGIKPEWEDKANRSGGEWFFRKTLDLSYLDEVWTKLALSMVGETLDVGDEVTGARVVDKSIRGKAVYRLELWFRSKSEAEPLKTALQNEFNDPKRPFHWEFRPHS